MAAFTELRVSLHLQRRRRRRRRHGLSTWTAAVRPIGSVQLVGCARSHLQQARSTDPVTALVGLLHRAMLETAWTPPPAAPGVVLADAVEGNGRSTRPEDSPLTRIKHQMHRHAPEPSFTGKDP